MAERSVKQARIEDSKEAILDVAGKLFAELGFSETSSDAIAEMSRVSKPTLYRRFPSKAAMLQAIRKRRYEGLINIYEEISRSPNSPLNKLQILFKSHMTYAIKHKTDFVTLLTERKHMAKIYHDEGWDNLYIVGVKTLFSEAVSNGSLRSDLDTDISARNFIALANWPAMWFAEDRGSITMAALCDETWRTIQDGVIG